VFAGMDGDERSDYLWLDPKSWYATNYLNTGLLIPNNRTVAGWVGCKAATGVMVFGFTVESGEWGRRLRQ